MKYEALYNLTLEQGGATVRVKDYPDAIVMPAKGFAVGNWQESVVTFIDQTAFDDAVDRMLDWVANSDIEYFGTWLRGDVIEIDPVDVFASREFALGVAYGRGEQAIYDLANKKEIYLR